jgi:hypothetical protein
MPAIHGDTEVNATNNRVYILNPQNIDELKLKITNKIESISSETLRNVSENMVRRKKNYLNSFKNIQ